MKSCVAIEEVEEEANAMANEGKALQLGSCETIVISKSGSTFLKN